MYFTVISLFIALISTIVLVALKFFGKQMDPKEYPGAEIDVKNNITQSKYFKVVAIIAYILTIIFWCLSL